MTTEELARLRALCDAATPGPWEWATSNSFRRLLTAEQDGVLQPTTQRSDGQPDIAGAAADMDFITTARTALPLLLDEVERLRAENQRLTDDDSRHRVWRSGAHLGAVRRWIQWHCVNGSDVTWGSTDRLRRDFTVLDLEEIAERVREALAAEDHE